VEIAETVTGAPSREIIAEIVFSGLAKKDADTALSAIQKAEARDIDPKRLFKRVIETVRQILLYRFEAVGEDLKRQVGDSLYAKITKEADRGADSSVKADMLADLLAGFNENNRSFDALAHTALELVIMDICSADKTA
jgi:DNA polymerase III gamma/tau subunit